MRRIIRSISIATLLVGTAGAWSTAASAQATRTWVSGVGDDVNPCSRTAPCKTFAGAISKTAAGGEINCIDPGGFGAVTITKSLTIDCHYTEGGVLAGGNGITVNAASTDVVVIRGLDIFGVNPPSNGVRIIAGGAVHIEDCVIRRFNAANSFGISFQPSGATRLYVTNTTISENGNGITGGGILVQPGVSALARIHFNNAHIVRNSGDGIRLDTTGNTGGGILGLIDQSDVSGSTQGVHTVSPAGSNGVFVMLTNSAVTDNSSNGVFADGPGTQLFIGNSSFIANGVALLSQNGAGIRSYSDNRVDGNTVTDGTFTSPVAKK